MSRSHVVVVDPKAPADLLEYDLEGRAGTFLVELLELAEAQGSALEWIQIGEGTLVERILARRTPAPSPEKLAKAQVRVKAPTEKAKYPTAKRRRKCPHCGELFASRGIGPHIRFVHERPDSHPSKVAKARRLEIEAQVGSGSSS